MFVICLSEYSQLAQNHTGYSKSYAYTIKDMFVICLSEYSQLAQNHTGIQNPMHTQ